MYMKTKQTNKQREKGGEKEIDSSFWMVCTLPLEDP